MNELCGLLPRTHKISPLKQIYDIHFEKALQATPQQEKHRTLCPPRVAHLASPLVVTQRQRHVREGKISELESSCRR